MRSTRRSIWKHACGRTIPPIITHYSQTKAKAEVLNRQHSCEFQLGIPGKCTQRSHVAVRSKVPGVLSANRKLAS